MGGRSTRRTPSGSRRSGKSRRTGSCRSRTLGEVGVRVAVVDEGDEELHRLPDAHRALARRKVLALLLQHKVERLAGVAEPVELPDAGPRLRPVVAELLGSLLGIRGLKAVPCRRF